MMDFYQLMVLALAVEAIWETFKMVWQEGKFSWDRLGAMVLGIMLCTLSEIDFFTIVGVPLNVQVMGYVFSGMIISRGSNVLHDLLDAIVKLADAK